MLPALPQARRTLAAGPVPVGIAGIALAAPRPRGRPPAVCAEARRRHRPRRQGRPLLAMRAPVPGALLTPPPPPLPRGADAPTDAAGARAHPNLASNDPTCEKPTATARAALRPSWCECGATGAPTAPWGARSRSAARSGSRPHTDRGGAARSAAHSGCTAAGSRRRAGGRATVRRHGGASTRHTSGTVPG